MPCGATEGGIVSGIERDEQPIVSSPSSVRPSEAEVLGEGRAYDPARDAVIADANAEAVRPQRRGVPIPLHRVWLTRVLLIINIVVFAVTTFLARGDNFMNAFVNGADVLTLITLGAKSNPNILVGQYWRLVTPIFLHIGIIHLLFNSYALNLFGREVEQLFGSLRFAIIYFLAGIAGSMLSFAFSPSVSAGASGAIFGIIGAMAAFLIRNRETFGETGRQHLRSLGAMIVLNLVLGVTLAGIDNFGHVGGLVTGAILGFALSPTYQVDSIMVPPFQTVTDRMRPVTIAIVTLVALGVLSALFVVALQIAPTGRL